MASQRIGVYPGSFDPITNGHTDIILRAAKIVDRLIIAIAPSDSKKPLFSLEERTAMAADDVAAISGSGSGSGSIEVVSFNGLLMDFTKEVGASMVVRGLRAVSDFEYEFQMAGMNARLNPDVETVFLTASENNHFISSRFVKEIAAHGGDIKSFVSANVARKLQERFS